MTDLFDNSLLPRREDFPEGVKTLPEGYKLRALRDTDFNTGFLACLRDLTTVGEVSEDGFRKQFDAMRKHGGYYIVVIEYPSQTKNPVVAAGTLIVERKFIHDLGAVGHIEDIAVIEDHQRRGLGKQLILALDSIAKNVKCYKSILDCSESNEIFYNRCDFKRAGLQMAHYYPASKSESQ